MKRISLALLGALVFFLPYKVSAGYIDAGAIVSGCYYSDQPMSMPPNSRANLQCTADGSLKTTTGATAPYPTPIPFPSVQAVSGTVNVAGTVSVAGSFPTPIPFPSVQPVSISAPVYATFGGPNAATMPAGASGPTVIKSIATYLATATVTTSGTLGIVTFYDNASACSGRVLGVVPGTNVSSLAVAGATYSFQMPAANGITACGTTLGPAVTLSYW